jgi:hypothetical protein
MSFCDILPGICEPIKIIATANEPAKIAYRYTKENIRTKMKNK